MRRATPYSMTRNVNLGVISIHALHEESDGRLGISHRYRMISIHALHEESDELRVAACRMEGISIHALHEESDKSAMQDLTS